MIPNVAGKLGSYMFASSCFLVFIRIWMYVNVLVSLLEAAVVKHLELTQAPGLIDLRFEKNSSAEALQKAQGRHLLRDVKDSIPAKKN